LGTLLGYFRFKKPLSEEKSTVNGSQELWIYGCGYRWSHKWVEVLILFRIKIWDKSRMVIKCGL
jgi:hypothetical protein